MIHPFAASDSIAELARALDLPASMPLSIDGRSVAPHERLVTSGLRAGSAITAGAADRGVTGRSVTGRPTAGSASAEFACVEVAVVVGPSCTLWIGLAVGRHVIGRAAGVEVRIDDPGVELHHGILDVGLDGSVVFTQLAGRVPVTVDGGPCSAGCRLEPGASLRIGSSRLQLRSVDGLDASGRRDRLIERGSLAAIHSDPWRLVVRRGPVRSVQPVMPTLRLPDPPAVHRGPPATSLVGAGLAVAGAALMAAVLGQMLFALFAGVGAIGSFATWGVGTAGARRRRRRADLEHRAALVLFERELRAARVEIERCHRATNRTVVDALDTLHGSGGDVWSRRCGDDGVLQATIGRGTCRWNPPIDADDRGRLDANLLVALDECEQLVDVAVPLVLEPESVVAFRGDPSVTAGVLRSIVVQLSADYGPADWQLLVVTDSPDDWSWTAWLPHARGARPVVATGEAQSLVDALERSAHVAGRRVVIVSDASELLTVRTGPLRRRLDRGDATCLVAVPTAGSVPAIAARVLEFGTTGGARWAETSAGSAWNGADTIIETTGVSRCVAEEAARTAAPLLDPEDDEAGNGLPKEVTLASLQPLDPGAATAIARRWTRAGRDPAPIARLGMSADGIVDVDLVRDGPHGLIAGTTGSGKSELLRTLVVSLASEVSPDHLSMILVDFKGGSTFDACARLPHTVGVVTDLDDGLAERVLLSLDAEIRRRERLLRAAGVDDLAGYRRVIDEPLPRLVVVVDEFASLARELPDFLHALVDVAQRGRSLGVHLLLATQRPAGVVTDDIRANTNLRIALRLHDRADALDVVGDEIAASFGAGTPGRAVLRLGADALVVFQTATASAPVTDAAGRLHVEHLDRRVVLDPADALARAADRPSMLSRLVDVIREAASIVGASPPHRPWIDALAPVVHRCELDASEPAVGIVDDPANQCRLPLSWQPGDGNLLLVGSVGTGTTSTALAALELQLTTTDPSDLHAYVIDAQGGACWSGIESFTQCGAVVRLAELERLCRVLARLARELDGRAATGARRPHIVVVIDGIAAVRDALADIVLTEASVQLDRVVRDGPALGVFSCVTTDGASPGMLALPRSATWVFGVDDPAVARSVGVRSPCLSSGTPGRLVVAETGLQAQVFWDPEFRATPSSTDACTGLAAGPGRVTVLAEMVDPHDLDAVPSPAVTLPGEPMQLVVGLSADDLEPAVLRVPLGDHIFIGGAARTGRSTSLRQVEAAWRQVHANGTVIHIDRSSSDSELRDLGAVRTDRVGADDPVLIVVDDAERVDDSGGRLAEIAEHHRAGVTLAIAARLESVRVGYGHWARAVTRSRCGLIMTSTGDVDGELLGVTLPRRSIIAARPGLAWMIDQHGRRLVQVAARMPP